MEMVELLISEGVELRNETNIERVSLKELCEAVSLPIYTYNITLLALLYIYHFNNSFFFSYILNVICHQNLIYQQYLI